MSRLRRSVFVLLIVASLCLLLRQSARMQSPLRRITNTSEEGISINPALSGDGRIIAFESTEDIAGAGGSESFRAIRGNVSVDPATFQQMGGMRAPAPAISQDGSRIAFSSRDNPLGTNNDSNPEIFLHDGAKLTQITNTSPGDLAHRIGDGNFLPSISDDGNFIAFSSNRDLAGQNSDGNFEIFVFDTVALSFSQLTNSAGIVGATDAKISGNGANVAYIMDTGATPSARRDLLLQSRLGLAPLHVLASGAQALAMTYGRGITDDGARVVYAAETAPNSSQVFLYDGRRNVTRRITSLGVRATDVPLHATINGDGSKIAFATRRSFLGNSDGGVDLYIYDIPSSTFQRVTSAPSTATAEVLSSFDDDGSVIAFNFPRVLTGVSNDEFANNSEIYITQTPPRPAFGSLTILNGASFGHEPASTQAIAPDSIAVARGTELAKTTEQSQRQPDGSFPFNTGGTTVTVNGRPAQIFFVSPTQVNFHVPPATGVATAEVVITNSEGFPSRGTVSSPRAAPGVFTYSSDGLGDGVVLDADTLQPGPFDPTSGNLRLIIFSTGVHNGSQVSVTAGGRALTFEPIVSSPSLPGLDELHVHVPPDLRGAGTVELVVRAAGRDSNPVTVTFAGDSHRDIVINEFLADPPGGDASELIGDANHDGARSAGNDEFVELVNNTTHDIDISGYQILTRGGSGTTDTVRHTFASATILPGCTVIVVFGGGNPDVGNAVFGGAQILKASSGSLSLSNTGGVVTLRDPATAVVNLISYGGSTGLDGNANQSLTRSPDVTGEFTMHQSAGGSGGAAFSPGTRVSGSPFSFCQALARVEVSPSPAAIDEGDKQQFTAQAYDANNQPISGIIFLWQSSKTGVATIDLSGLATGTSAGSTEITAIGRGVQSTPATLTVRARVPPPIVISQIYGGGGNSGAAYKNDFIEIFNRGSTTVDLAGWSVQQASAAGTSWSVTALCPSGSCLLGPGKYFLLLESSGGAVGADLPKPDASGTSNLAATSGKIALVTNTTPLNGSGCPFGSAVIDFVGYGTTADCFEGASHAPAPSAINSDLRLAGGCTDTNENSTDFAVGTPNPRNTVSASNDCNAPPPSPSPSSSPSPSPSSSPSPGPSPAPMSPVVISEFRTRGPSGASDEFVELYNNSDSIVDISGWKIKGSSSTGATITNKLTINNGT
ncbi:MAG: lamin tail domain-containing protein, partial [Acidobacteriota bacterium]|nr:lamin tail domain-containing protein [Acidobacteriota bacterium]